MCGLELLSAVLFKMRDHEHLVTTMQECTSGGGRALRLRLVRAYAVGTTKRAALGEGLEATSARPAAVRGGPGVG